jgi:outer membrane receptor protein involved in Fe transport
MAALPPGRRQGPVPIRAWVWPGQLRGACKVWQACLHNNCSLSLAMKTTARVLHHGSGAVALLLLATSAAAAGDEPPQPLPKVTILGTAENGYVAPDAGTGTMTTTPVMDTPLDIQVVTQQVLQDQQVTRIDQALRNVSGITFTNGGDTSFGNAFDAVVLRGFATDSHLRDGMRIDSFGSDSELFTQQLANVESIEVLKGPAAILYGAVEPGGVVNIVTKQPQATASETVEQQLGSYGLYRTTLGATGPLDSAGNVLYRVDASYDTSGSIVDLGFKRDLFVAPTLKVLIGRMPR